MYVSADIIGVVEADDRPSLARFNKEMLDDQYRHIMLIDGNDERVFDMGLMTKAGFPIKRITSNIFTEYIVSAKTKQETAHSAEKLPKRMV